MKKMRIKKELNKRCLDLAFGKEKQSGPLSQGFVYLDREPFKLIDPNKQIYIVYDNDFLNSKGLVFGAALPISRFDGNTSYVIVTDKYFDEAPNYLKKFVLLHEMGHIYLGHFNGLSSTDSVKMVLKRAIGIINSNEYEADSFAAKYIGKRTAIQALKWIYNVTDLSFAMKMESKRRIEKLENL